MRKHLFPLILIFIFILVACRREEEEQPLPTLAPTAVLPTPTSQTTSTDITTEEEPTAVSQATPLPQPTATTPPLPAVDLADIDWPPQLLYSSPAPGEKALLDGAITLRFDQPMDQASVEENFVVETADSAQTASGTFTWPRPDTLVFTPRSDLNRAQKYNISLSQTALSANGQTLFAPINLQLETIGYLEASQLIPTDGNQNVQTDTAITILFNRPVVPLVSTSQQAGLPQPLTLDPPVDGTGEWISTSIYRFTPTQPLDGATTYTAQIAAGLEDVTGGLLQNDITWSFTTLSPSVVSTQPDTGAANINPTLPLTITFNMPMERESTENAVTLRGGSSGQLDFQWSDNDRVLTIIPRQPLDLETDYRLFVGQFARSANGQANMDAETVTNFSTVPFPAVISTTPRSGATADPWQRGFTVGFTAPMDVDTLEDHILINPTPTGRINYYFNEFNFELYVDFALERNTDYTITIPNTAADPFGNTIGRDYTWQFTAPGYGQIASFNLPQQISQLSSSFPTRVGIIHINTPQLDVALYDIGLPLNFINNPYELNDYVPATNPLRTWSIPIETEADQAGLYTLPLADGSTLPNGIYYLSLATDGDDPNVRYWQNRRHLLIVADTNIVVKEMFDEAHVWVTDLATGEPVSGRNLTFYNDRGAPIGTAVSDNNGFASFAYSRQEYLAGVTVISSEAGQPGFGVGSSRWSGGANPWEMGISNIGYSADSPTFAYLYTDRPIYRPGDTISYKGIVRDNNYGRYTPPTPQSITINLTSYNFYIENGVDETFTVQVESDGTFSGEYLIPDDIPLGSYQFSISSDGINAFRTFTVAEYRAPEFLASVTPDRPDALRGETIDITVQADYFFGGPATDLNLNWTVYADTFRPRVAGPYYEFGDGGGYYYRDFGPFGGGFGETGLGEWVTGGEGQTDGNGRFTFTLPADLLNDFDPGSRQLTIEVTINDLSEFPVSTRTRVTMHAAASYVGIIPSDYLINAGQAASVNLLTTDWAGEPSGNQSVEVIFYQREWRSTRTNDYGIYYTAWEPIDTEVARAQVTTDAQGEASASFTPEFGGSYVAIATVTDSSGRTQQSSTNLWVIDPGYGGWRTDPKERSMELTADQDEYSPGDTAHILVQSPFTEPVQAWLTIERGRLIEQRVITLPSSSEVVDIPITADHAPNIYVSIVAIKPVNSEDNPYADIRLGIVELPVSTEQLALNLELTPQGSNFAPGSTVTYDILVTDYAGNPVTADLSLALVDLAVLTLKEDNAPNILEAFYAPQPYRSQVGAGLFISGEGLEPEIPFEGGGFGGGGGGLEADAALARAVGEEDDVRRDFRDTAYWTAHITTDANGQASVSITLPDNLTTWRLSSKAVTDNTLVGQTNVDIIASLPLLIRPVTPRFLTVGDVVQLGAIVNNNTGSAIEATVTLEADGLTLRTAEQTVSIAANSQELVRWPVTVNDVQWADLTFRVAGGGFSDASKPTFGEGDDQLIPVYRFNAEDVVGTSGVLAESGRRVEALLLPPNADTRIGAVDITLSPSLAAAMIETLQAHNELDYIPACAHWLANRLLPNVATLRALNELNLDNPPLTAELTTLIETAVAQLETLQLSDGGWTWCYNTQSDPYISAITLLSLIKAQQAGFAVDSAVIEGGISYVARQVRPAASLTETYDINRQAFYLYVLAEATYQANAEADELFDEHRALLDPAAKALLALVYELSGDAGDNQESLLADVNDAAILSATGAFWQNTTQDYRSFMSDVRGTAVIIDALTRIQPDNGLLPQAVRWLMAARQTLIWETPLDTATAVSALTDYMLISGELEADFGYGLLVNGQEWTDGAFTPETITSNDFVSVANNRLVRDVANFFEFRRGEGNGSLYYTMHLDSFVDANSVTAVNRGFTVQRTYYDADCDPETETCEPITQLAAGQQVRVELTIIAEHDMFNVIVQDPIPAGAEAIDPTLDTSAAGYVGSISRTDDEFRYGYWGWWYFDRIEYRDEQVRFLSQFLPAGTYQYTYYLQATIPGEFQVMPTTARQEFFPEVFGRSDGLVFTVAE
ncbi:MAG: Ig-like domain-containing protein [Ardenticatenaceae bacterium]|nr:Ig-like domain-containing protein [Ardenticatenaceae bacterium]